MTLCLVCGNPKPHRPKQALAGRAGQIYCGRKCAAVAATVPTIELLKRHTPNYGGEGCWDWNGCIGPKGYGQATERYGERIAHRISYAFHTGLIPPGAVVMHSCDNRRCINPNHLVIGTQADNMADMIAKDRGAHGEKNGHAKLTDDAVRSIRQDSRKYRLISAEFGVSHSTISEVKRGLKWKHVQ